MHRSPPKAAPSCAESGGVEPPSVTSPSLFSRQVAVLTAALSMTAEGEQIERRSPQAEFVATIPFRRGKASYAYRMICARPNCSRPVTGRRARYCSNSCKVMTNIDRMRVRRREQAIAMLGGRCSRCGYDRCSAALSFHHMDNKSFALSGKDLVRRAWSQVEAELQKCILLCANCHMEEHWAEGQGLAP